jgi:hypothetical protein
MLLLGGRGSVLLHQLQTFSHVLISQQLFNHLQKPMEITVWEINQFYTELIDYLWGMMI